MERNSEYISIKSGLRIKAVDCKVFSAMLQDIVRHKTVLKVEDENYIFIRRAISVKQASKNQKRK
jgi:hypothetical protein